jgi:hypothetical protein
MNVGFDLLWWLYLDDQVDVGNIKAARRNISSDEDLEFAFLESLHGDLSLVLCDITVHDLNILLNLVTQDKTVSISLSLSEHDCLAETAVADKHVSESGKTVLERTADGKMLHLARGFILQVLGQVNNSAVRLHVLVGDLTDPGGNGGGKQADLQILAAGALDVHKNALDVLFETKLKHLIGLIEDNSSHLGEINVTALDMVENAASGSNKNVDSTAEFAGLVLNGHTAVDSKRVVLTWVVLDVREDTGDLTRCFSFELYLPKWPIHVWEPSRLPKFCGYQVFLRGAKIQSRAMRIQGSCQIRSNHGQ